MSIRGEYSRYRRCAFAVSVPLKEKRRERARRERNAKRKMRSRFSDAKETPPPVETPKSRAATEAQDLRAARPMRRAGPAHGRGVKQADQRTYRKRRVLARPERAKHRAKLACASDRRGSRFSASVKRRGGGFRRGNARECECGQRPRLVFARGGDGDDPPPVSGRDRNKTDLRGSRDPRRRCSPCPFGSSRAVALRRTGVGSSVAKGPEKNIKPRTRSRGARARREARGKTEPARETAAVARAPRLLLRGHVGKRAARCIDRRVSVVTSWSPAPKSADRERRDAKGGTYTQGPPWSPLLRLRRLLSCVCASS